MSSALGDVLGGSEFLVVMQSLDFSVVLVNHVALTFSNLLSDGLVDEVLVSSHSVSICRRKGVSLEDFKLGVRDSLRALNVGSEFKEILEVGTFGGVDGKASQRGVSVVALLVDGLSNLDLELLHGFLILFLLGQLSKLDEEGLVDNFGGSCDVVGVLDESFGVENGEEEANQVSSLGGNLLGIYAGLFNLRDQVLEILSLAVELLHHLVESGFVNVRSLPD